MKKIAVYNIKGGDGKSTASRTLAMGLAMNGHRILLADADGQANSSKTFIDQKMDRCSTVYDAGDAKNRERIFIERYMNQNHGRTISELFQDPKKIKEVIQRSCYDHLDILPSDLTLYLADTNLRLQDGTRENKLKRACNFIKDDYDFMIFDCSPVKSLVSVNVLYTNPFIIIPVSPFDDSMQGLALTINEINTMMQLYEELELEYRILIVKNRRNNECKNNCMEIRAAFGDKVFKTEIRDQAKPVEKAARERKTVLNIAQTNVSDDYLNLIKELEAVYHD